MGVHLHLPPSGAYSRNWNSTATFDPGPDEAVLFLEVGRMVFSEGGGGFGTGLSDCLIKTCRL